MSQIAKKETDELANGVGRPTVLTEEVVQKLESVFKLGVTIDAACTYANIARSTFYDHYNHDIEFRTKIDTAKDYARIAAGSVVINAIVKDRDVEAAKWWLAKKHPDEFGDVRKLSGVSISDGDKEYKLVIEDYISGEAVT